MATEEEREEEIDEETVEMLRKSKEVVGYLSEVIVDQQGNILSGRHRKLADPNWPEKRVHVTDPLHRELLILHYNVQRPISKEERQRSLLKIARLIESMGVPKHEVCSYIIKNKLTPFTDRYIRELLPDEYKEQAKARAPQETFAELSSARSAIVGVKTQETQERKSEQAITVPASASGSVAPTLPSSQPKSLVEEPPLVRIIDKLKRYYPLSLIDWVYEFCQFDTAEQGAKLLKQVLEAVWKRIESELGEEWIRNVVSEAIRR